MRECDSFTHVIEEVLLSYEILLGLRQLKSRKRSRVISTLTMISILGVLVGVFALTVVMSILNGFGHDLREKIVKSTPNIIVERHEGEMIRYKSLCDKVSKDKDVKSCSGFLRNEVMIASKNNTSGVLLWGIQPQAGRIREITKRMNAGRFNYLFQPHKIPKPKTRAQRYNKLALTAEERKWLGLPPLKRGASGAAAPSAPATRKSKAPLQDLPVLAPKDAAPKDSTSTKPKKSDDDDDGLPAEFALTKPKSKKRRKQLPALLLGQELALSLGVSVGDEVRVISPIGGGLTPMGPAPRIRRFRIGGVFFTGMYEYDTKFAFSTLQGAQNLFRMGDSISGLEISVKDIYQTPRIKKRLLRRVGGGPYHVRDWIDLNRRLFSALMMEKMLMFIVLTFIILVASFNIVSTLIMIVLEKAKEIAILKSMGATRRSIMQIFMVEGVVIGVVGTVLGLILGWRACTHLMQFPIRMDGEVFYVATVPIRMNGSDFLFVALAAVLLSFLATVYPALQAARLRPVEGLQHD